MIVLHSASEIERLRAAGRVARATLESVSRRVHPGVTTHEIDCWVREDTARRGARPSQLGYKGFRAAVCTSRNHVVCHGVPSKEERVSAGDILNIDVTSELQGFHGDTSITLEIGEVSKDAHKVVDVARRCLWAGIERVRPGARLGEIGAAIETLARAEGCGVVREFCGHGIGRRMHMPPEVRHFGPGSSGPRLREGMAFTIEPMITLGWPSIVLREDGWTVETADGSPSAQFEHTVLVTRDGVEVLTG